MHSRTRVLVIEERPFQSSDIEGVLNQIGCYRISTVLEPDQLEQVLTSSTGPFDMAVCTAGSFAMDDIFLLERICSGCKVQHVVLLAEYDAEHQHELLFNAWLRHIPLIGFLRKPLTSSALAEMLECLPRWTVPSTTPC
ncbi:ANTAR domain-containing protein [Phytopseudomonas dryadis]|uniref:Response regulatory domain-containing protein n=1 Tax=Phytopseudomonas dryadis TaxID=2487520 RepID=A0A4Q9R7T9_9GAMM|nr:MULTISPECIES: hypothetical protein [Pseudomonas]TBU96153.1 hypothetical protein DNK44_05195 [Pseudomonas dryadis]TBV02816.1 hypothetical protein DNK34_17840 [Pseudomonas dryadis]TBV15938.1 hypothetical protein DNK41_16935 [Pseudomonas sp. FRB 230]